MSWKFNGLEVTKDRQDSGFIPRIINNTILLRAGDLIEVNAVRMMATQDGWYYFPDAPYFSNFHLAPVTENNFIDGKWESRKP